MIVMAPTEGHGAEPTEAVTSALNNCDVAFGATTNVLISFKSPFRRK